MGKVFRRLIRFAGSFLELMVFHILLRFLKHLLIGCIDRRFPPNSALQKGAAPNACFYKQIGSLFYTYVVVISKILDHLFACMHSLGLFAIDACTGSVRHGFRFGKVFAEVNHLAVGTRQAFCRACRLVQGFLVSIGCHLG